MREFKFRVKNNGRVLRCDYTAKVVSDTTVVVGWTDKKGLHTVEYSVKDMEKYLKQGSWLITA